jgi:chromosome segregation ATPase
MSEERLERIETQIAKLREIVQQNMLTTQHNMNSMQENMTAMQQNMNAMREDLNLLRQRSDSVEGTVVVAMREGFNSLRNYLDDLNYDLAEVERKVSDGDRKHRRLNRRVARLERKEEED